MSTATEYHFDDMVRAIGDAATEVLLRSGGRELTFSASARDEWVAHIEAAVRRMVEEGRTNDEALGAAQAAARTVIQFAAETVNEYGDEVTEPDISEAMRRTNTWPFSDVSNETRIPAGHEAAARRAAAVLLERQVLRMAEFLRELPENVDPIPRLAPMLALSRTALDAVQEPAFFIGLCPDDGTRVEYDYTIGEYCCALRHCPPG
jgi:hypothetical protein